MSDTDPKDAILTDTLVMEPTAVKTPLRRGYRRVLCTRSPCTTVRGHMSLFSLASGRSFVYGWDWIYACKKIRMTWMCGHKFSGSGAVPPSGRGNGDNSFTAGSKHYCSWGLQLHPSAEDTRGIMRRETECTCLAGVLVFPLKMRP